MRFLFYPSTQRTWLIIVADRHCGIAPDGTRVKDSAPDSELRDSVEDKLTGLQIQTSHATPGPELNQHTIEEDETMYVNIHVYYACAGCLLSL